MVCVDNKSSRKKKQELIVDDVDVVQSEDNMAQWGN